ncbi:YitT family protein, partial [Clostridioides difficile]|nr:YitT family protein [Clostridioides difficile]
MRDRFKYFLMLTVSTLVMAIGTYFFKFANNFTFGGITGLAVLVARSGVMSAGDFNFIM